ncbi:glycosyltransferase family 39 protein [Cellulomonas hominis]|uniref:Glycosyltransferase RgtA/B/C/D-like domain-containing protein n=1 Tax=Cellulomonas hominis TaxID=156981 RepID=A0A7W8SFV4_9CELL|nr:glycosyltransferase family 39 protein [Cellulomonas hominis]MBB5474014.1 hypothetical protein [Cellulomonas hominis]MBU5424035.1 glycosyltransferase family 39 protein [Cellulomonas hominis]
MSGDGDVTAAAAVRAGTPGPRAAAARVVSRPVRVATVVAAWSTVLAVHLVAAWPAYGPVWTDDEIGVLANARFLAGRGALELAHQSYYPGWSVLLVPVWWVTSDPVQVYRAAVLVSALCGAGLMAPLTLLARRVGLGLVPATLVAGAVAVMPNGVTYSTTALTENFLALCTAVVAVCGLRYVRRRSVGSAVALGATAGWTFVVHGRMAALVAMTVVWMLVEGLRRRRAGWVGAGVAVAVTAAGYALHRWVSGTLYSDTSRESLAVDNLLGGTPSTLVQVAAGHLWYASVAWVLLAALGLVLVVDRVVRETRRRRPDVGWWALGAVLGTAAISVLTMASVRAAGENRLDVPSYGRYLEPLLAVLACLGLALVVRRAAPARLVVASALVIAAVASLAYVPWITRVADPSAWWAPINVPGLLGLVGAGLSPLAWTAASAVTLVAGALLLAARRSPAARVAWAAGFAAYGVCASAAALTGVLWDFNRAQGVEPGLMVPIRALAGEPLSYDSAGADWTSQNSFQYWTADTDVDVFDSDDGTAPTDLVIARADWPAGVARGAELVATSDRDEALWVLPGALADDLAARGALVPEDPTAPLQGFGATAEAVGGAPGGVVPAGGTDLVVRLSNTGASPWQPLGAFPDPTGAVRLVAWWTRADGTVEPQFGELRGTVLPGATADVRIELRPPADAVGDVAVTLVQEGVGELTPPGEPLLVLPTAAG